VRDNLIVSYQIRRSLAQSRAAVLLALANNATIRQANYNSAFVLTEYFGYLQRDPERAGFDYWLNVLNNREADNYRGMVCAFIFRRSIRDDLVRASPARMPNAAPDRSTCHSAKGARYDSQGQATKSRRPWTMSAYGSLALKGRNNLSPKRNVRRTPPS